MPERWRFCLRRAALNKVQLTGGRVHEAHELRLSGILDRRQRSHIVKLQLYGATHAVKTGGVPSRPEEHRIAEVRNCRWRLHHGLRTS